MSLAFNHFEDLYLPCQQMLAPWAPKRAHSTIKNLVCAAEYANHLLVFA